MPQQRPAQRRILVGGETPREHVPQEGAADVAGEVPRRRIDPFVGDAEGGVGSRQRRHDPRGDQRHGNRTLQKSEPRFQQPAPGDEPQDRNHRHKIAESIRPAAEFDGKKEVEEHDRRRRDQKHLVHVRKPPSPPQEIRPRQREKKKRLITEQSTTAEETFEEVAHPIAPAGIHHPEGPLGTGHIERHHRSVGGVVEPE